MVEQIKLVKLNSLFYFLFNDMVERINYKLFGHNPYEYIERSPRNFNGSAELEMSAQIYEEKTVRAINDYLMKIYNYENN